MAAATCKGPTSVSDLRYMTGFGELLQTCWQTYETSARADCTLVQHSQHSCAVASWRTTTAHLLRLALRRKRV